MVNKYNLNINKSTFDKNIMRLVNQIWKLIPMKENEEDYIKQLDTVIIEFAGLEEIFQLPHFLQILAKLEGLKKQEDIEFSLYRKTIFEVINLLGELKEI